MTGPKFIHNATQTPPTQRGDDWRDAAACKDDPGPWDHDAHPDDQEEAQRICWNECLVRQQCDKFRRDNDIDAGIWGGELYGAARHRSKETA